MKNFKMKILNLPSERNPINLFQTDLVHKARLLNNMRSRTTGKTLQRTFCRLIRNRKVKTKERISKKLLKIYTMRNRKRKTKNKAKKNAKSAKIKKMNEKI